MSFPTPHCTRSTMLAVSLLLSHVALGANCADLIHGQSFRLSFTVAHSRAPQRYHHAGNLIALKQVADFRQWVAALSNHFRINENTVATFTAHRKHSSLHYQARISVPFSGEAVTITLIPRTQKSLERVRNDFFKILDQLDAHQFPRNETFQTEKTLASAATPRHSPLRTLRTEEILDSALADHSIILIPDVHYPNHSVGNLPRTTLLQVMRHLSLDWIALEMLPRDMQSQADQYLALDGRTSAFRTSKESLFSYLDLYWGHEESQYHSILELARRRHVRIIGMEPADYRPIEGERTDGISMATRNYLWAQSIPKRGKGIVFGGLAHFLSSNIHNFQDFLDDRPVYFLDWGLSTLEASPSLLLIKDRYISIP